MTKRKARPLTEQEAMVAQFANFSVSASATFHPKLWRNGREPADMIVVIGRAMLFVNMTAGRSYFDDLAKHNIEQAEGRIRDWQGGLSIKGKNAFRDFSIDYNDIDAIAVVSVVSGPYAACCDHPLPGLSLPPKARLCTSLTTDVVEEIAKRGGGARDIIDLCKTLVGQGQVSQDAMLDRVRSRHAQLVNTAKAQIILEPQSMGQAMIAKRPVTWFEEFVHKLILPRGLDNVGLSFIADLDWSEVYNTAAFITRTAASMEYVVISEPIRWSEFGRTRKFGVIVSCDSKRLASQMNEYISLAEKREWRFTYVVSLSDIGPMELFSFKEGSKLMIETEL
ncbi:MULTISPECIES: hypothetical protein [unclassified Phyllobacterium]|uniref:hypothetical protein n=1 Tax=unclassified Phyllobacterium TaxID=2638441 RepID=UPI003012FFA5